MELSMLDRAPQRRSHPDPSTFKNSLLRRFGPEIIDRLALQRVSFELGHEIEFPGKSIAHLFFVEEGMASLTTTFRDGSQVEAGMFGCESVIGVSALMGTRQSLNRIYTQVAGSGYSCTVEAARREFGLCGAFQRLTLHYVQAQLLQAMQSAGCNATHEVDQRLARWLLLCADRVHSNTFIMSQEYLAHMLGASRPTVTIAAGNLKKKGLIQYTRGLIHIPDTGRLEQQACECYHVIRDHLHNLAEFDDGDLA
jgi:CRP-like cAMP-binding protein